MVILTKEDPICIKPFIVKVLIFCCVLCIFPQCTHLKTPLPLSTSHVCTPKQILRKYTQEEGIPPGLKGIAKIKVESPDEKFSVKEIVIAQRPQYLRLETLNPLGQPLFFIVTDGEELSLFSPPENKFYHGVASRENVSLFFHINLSLEEMLSIIFGVVPLIEYDAEQTECWMKGDVCLLKLSTKEKKFTQILKIDFSDRAVVESETHEQGEGVILTTNAGR